jgi:hypothetical protein
MEKKLYRGVTEEVEMNDENFGSYVNHIKYVEEIDG